MDIPIVFQATSFVAYTPSASLLPWQFTTFYLTADANVTGIDYDGNTISAVAFKAGYQPVLMRVISTVSAGTVHIMRHSFLSRAA